MTGGGGLAVLERIKRCSERRRAVLQEAVVWTRAKPLVLDAGLGLALWRMGTFLMRFKRGKRRGRSCNREIVAAEIVPTQARGQRVGSEGESRCALGDVAWRRSGIERS